MTSPCADGARPRPRARRPGRRHRRRPRRCGARRRAASRPATTWWASAPIRREPRPRGRSCCRACRCWSRTRWRGRAISSSSRCPTTCSATLPGPVLDLIACGALHARQVVAHTSGRHGLNVLGPVARAGAITLAVHPAQTFGGTAADLPRLPGVAYGVTALGRHWPVAEWLVAELGGTPVAVPEELRPLWHAGLAHGANHLVTLVASALDIVRATGASDPVRRAAAAAVGGSGAHARAGRRGPDRTGRPRRRRRRRRTSAGDRRARARRSRTLYRELARATAAPAGRSGPRALARPWQPPRRPSAELPTIVRPARARAAPGMTVLGNRREAALQHARRSASRSPRAARSWPASARSCAVPSPSS